MKQYDYEPAWIDEISLSVYLRRLINKFEIVGKFAIFFAY